VVKGPLDAAWMAAPDPGHVENERLVPCYFDDLSMNWVIENVRSQVTSTGAIIATYAAARLTGTAPGVGQPQVN
jgi:hypothetical protein